jgi:hypothetical protein
VIYLEIHRNQSLRIKNAKSVKKSSLLQNHFKCTVCFWEAGKKKLALKQKKEKQAWKKEETEKLMTKSDYEKLLETEINTIVRLIDKGQPCIASGATNCKFNAGHFIAVGSNKSIRYNLHNIHIQSVQSNKDRGGEPIKYLDGLERIYGKEYAEYIHYEIRRKWSYMGWTISDLKEWTSIARLIVKELKELGNTYTPEERIELRTEYNFRLGIYK